MVLVALLCRIDRIWLQRMGIQNKERKMSNKWGY